MKIILFTPGLGNQIFQYFFCLYLKDKYPKDTVYGCYDKAVLNDHNGLEVQNVFDIELPPSSLFTHLIMRLTRALYKRTKWKCLGSHDEPFKDTYYYEGYWHDKELFEKYVLTLRFKEYPISQDNLKVLDNIESKKSVFIHIRRGDYLDPSRSEDFAHSCPISYYERGIQYAHTKFSDPYFFVFSDDIFWAKENIKVENVTYIDWNKGKNSFWDMYLMSRCKAGIIANSSFSFWGAMLGNPKQFVVKPKKWIGDWVPQIFPDSWITK